MEVTSGILFTVLFASLEFVLCFLPVALILHFILPAIVRPLLLVGMSCLFYIWGEHYYSVTIFSLSMVNYILGKQCDPASRRSKGYFVAAFIINIGTLLFYKYVPWSDFHPQSRFETYGVKFFGHLPLGISFFTFHSLAYISDIRSGLIGKHSYIQYLNYLTLFPHSIAGPIVRFSEINRFFVNRLRSVHDIESGLSTFVVGLSRKLLIADQVATIPDSTFSPLIGELDVMASWIGAIAYSIQIYFDFSGYSLMAIGLAKCFGYEFPKNFDRPYLATSISDFWRRWHISLGAWFRDYVYIPLGGSRNGTAKTRFNLFLVFLITGIWHGSSLNFLVWGAFYGALIVIQRFWLVSWLNSFLRVVAIYLLTLVGWVIFRSNDLPSVGLYLGSMIDVRRIAEVPFDYYLTNSSIIALVAGLVITFIGEPLVARVTDKSTIPILKKFNNVGVLLLFCVCLYLMSAATSSPFLYFRF
jgi:alginate O-acetyltransferase complex protein AlgI